MLWSATVTPLSAPDEALAIEAPTLDDLIWKIQIAIIDGTGPEVVTFGPENPDTPVEDYARRLSRDPADNPPTRPEGWNDLPPDPDGPTELFRVEVNNHAVIVWPLRQTKLGID